MPYARRDNLGQLLSLHRQPEADAQEHLPDDAPEVLSFLGQPHVDASGGRYTEPAASGGRSTEPAASGGRYTGPDAADNRYTELDADFVRVLEDLVDTLVSRNVINLTDLPLRARDKLYQRKGHRRETSLSKLNLLGETSGLGYADIPVGYLPPN